MSWYSHCIENILIVSYLAPADSGCPDLTQLRKIQYYQNQASLQSHNLGTYGQVLYVVKFHNPCHF